MCLAGLIIELTVATLQGSGEHSIHNEGADVSRIQKLIFTVLDISTWKSIKGTTHNKQCMFLLATKQFQVLSSFLVRWFNRQSALESR